jgi:hypothetical protein
MKWKFLYVRNCREDVRRKRTGEKREKRDRTIEERISSLLGRDEVERGWKGSVK